MVSPICLALDAANAIGRQLQVIGPAPTHLDNPCSGGSAVAIIALFVFTNGAAHDAAWRSVRRRSPDRLRGQEPSHGGA
jgi:hypothetical protein